MNDLFSKPTEEPMANEIVSPKTDAGPKPGSSESEDSFKITDLIKQVGGLPHLPGVGMDLITVGALLVKSGFFKDTKSVSQAVAKILAGQELGIGPLRSMSEIHIIEGKPALGSTLIASLIKRSGKYNFRTVEHTEEACEILFLEGDEEVGRSRFTFAQAEAAGLPKRGPSWHSFRRNMLWARALTNGARWFCADVFGGAVYTPEELGDAALPADAQSRADGPAAAASSEKVPA